MAITLAQLVTSPGVSHSKVDLFQQDYKQPHASNKTNIYYMRGKGVTCIKLSFAALIDCIVIGGFSSKQLVGR